VVFLTLARTGTEAEMGYSTKFLWVLAGVLSAPVFGEQLPDTMTKLTVRLQSPEVPEDSFAAKPKIMYRAGNRYCRTEELPDHEHGIHGLMIINEPDVWMVNLFTKTAQHFVDPGPTFNCRMPMFIGERLKPDDDMKNPLLDLEFGRELAYFKDKGATPKEGPVLQGKPTTVYMAQAGDSKLFLFTTGTPERPWAVARQHGDTREIYWYGTYEQIPFDSKLFVKPEAVKIEDSKH
jgi:hypothetical protein